MGEIICFTYLMDLNCSIIYGYSIWAFYHLLSSIFSDYFNIFSGLTVDGSGKEVNLKYYFSK